MSRDGAPATAGPPGGYPAQMRETRHLSAAAGLVALVALVAACAGGPDTPSPSNAPASQSSAPPASSSPVETAAPPTAEPSDTPSTSPDESPSPSDVGPSESPPPAGGSAAACTGSDNNRDFYVDAANALAFDVYCAVLPRGWFVDQGDYQLRSGGQLHITYKGPSGASLELLERGPCSDGDDCMPAGTEEGERTFGSLPATLVALDDGGLMIAAEDMTKGRWLVIGRGVDEAALTKIAADLALVGG